jgi:hypothetical protein
MMEQIDVRVRIVSHDPTPLTMLQQASCLIMAVRWHRVTGFPDHLALPADRGEPQPSRGYRAE